MTDVRDRILRRWWVVVLCVLVAVGAALVTGVSAQTTYTSKASLTTYSANRAPEQDAVLIQSYVDLFNNDAGQQSLRRSAGVPGDVRVTAMPVATGPIMFVVASGPDAASVPRAAQAMADAFRQSINAGVQRTRQSAIDALRRPFVDREARNDFIIEQERVQLQQSIDRLNSDTSGLLQGLTAASSATAERPAMTARLAVAVVVGLLVGLVLAWLVGGFAPRLRTAAEVREALGLRTFDASGDDADPRMQMRHVVNALAFDDLPVPSVLALTGVGGRAGSAGVADELARIRAAQGAEVVVVRTSRDGEFAGAGMVDVLLTPNGDGIHAARLDETLRSSVRLGRGVSVLGAGDPAPDGRGSDPYDVMTRENVGELIGLLRKRFDVVVVECAPVDEAAEAQLVCAGADRTLVVVERGAVSPTRGRRAADLVRQAGIEAFAAVVVAPPHRVTPSRLMSSH
ncbi:MAG: hypothetical protein PGN29_16790 [Gordonia paraffinivorans]